MFSRQLIIFLIKVQNSISYDLLTIMIIKQIIIFQMRFVFHKLVRLSLLL